MWPPKSNILFLIFGGAVLDSFPMSEIHFLLASHLQQDSTSDFFQPLCVVSGFVDTTIKMCHHRAHTHQRERSRESVLARTVRVFVSKCSDMRTGESDGLAASRLKYGVLIEGVFRQLRARRPLSWL